MTFVSAFYSFNIAIVDSAHDRYDKFRIKVPMHPTEAPEYLQARVLAYAHAYRPGLELSPGLFDPRLPTLIQRDLLGETLRWIEVGVPDKEKILRALRREQNAAFGIYFQNRDEVQRFCHYLRGSTTNWASQVNFFLLDPGFLSDSAGLLESSSNWELTFADDIVYLMINGVEFETRIEPVDIWREYQHSIENA